MWPYAVPKRMFFNANKFIGGAEVPLTGCNHQVEETQKISYAPEIFKIDGRNWSGKGDLNPRPSPWQGDALPLSYSRSWKKIALILVGTL